MKLNGIQNLFKMCLIIIATSATNLSMSIFFIKQQLKERLENYTSLSNLLTIDQILSAPQKNLTEKKTSQLKNNLDEVEVAIYNNKAYWVKNNHVYTSSINENGDVDIDNASEIDVFSLSPNEMNKLLKIIDKLND